jgi:hypothetical protein
MIVLWYFTRDGWAKFWSRGRTPILLFCVVLTLVTVWRWGYFDWMLRPITLPTWVLVLGLAAVSLFAWVVWLIAHALGLSKLRKPPMPHGGQESTASQWTKNATPDPLQYRNDEVFGVSWSWRYLHGLLDPDFVDAFCPTQGCKCRLEVKENYERASYRLGCIPVALICPHCGLSRDFDCGARELKRRVVVEIERRINTGEYLKRPLR